MPASRGGKLIERRCGILKVVAALVDRHKKEKEMKSIIKILSVMLCVFTGTTPLHAQWVQTNSPQGFQIQCLAASGTNLFAGDYQDGVFLSTDNGRNWTGMDSGLTNRNVNSLVVMGANLFAGTGGGVFISTNNGTRAATTFNIPHRRSINFPPPARWHRRDYPCVFIRVA